MDTLLTKSNNKYITWKKSNIDYKVFLSLRHFFHNYITATLVWELKKYIFFQSGLCILKVNTEIWISYLLLVHFKVS